MCCAASESEAYSGRAGGQAPSNLLRVLSHVGPGCCPPFLTVLQKLDHSCQTFEFPFCKVRRAFSEFVVCLVWFSFWSTGQWTRGLSYPGTRCTRELRPSHVVSSLSSSALHRTAAVILAPPPPPCQRQALYLCWSGEEKPQGGPGSGAFSGWGLTSARKDKDGPSRCPSAALWGSS